MALTGDDASPRSDPAGGAWVLVVGPDGSGKSTLARSLLEAATTTFADTMHVHWRPRVLPRIGGLVGVELGDPTEPHARRPRPAIPSLIMLLYHWLDFLLGSWMRIIPARRRGTLIVMERGWPDIAVDPTRYRVSVSHRVIELLGRALPAPDLVLVLRADPETILARKAELPREELARQVARWDEMRFPARTRRRVIDAAQPEAAILDEAIRAVSRSRLS